MKKNKIKKNDVPAQFTRKPAKGYCTIYKHTAPDGREYVGYVEKESVWERWQSRYRRNPEFDALVKDLRWDGFTHEILAENVPVRFKNFAENYNIIHHNSMVPNGFNINSGGDTAIGKNSAKPVFQIDKTTGEIIKLWESCAAAQRALKICHVSEVANELRKSAGGFLWQFPTDEALKSWLQKEWWETYGVPTARGLTIRWKSGGRLEAFYNDSGAGTTPAAPRPVPREENC